MSNEKKELISLSELDQLTHRCLTIMSLMDRLAGRVQNGAPEDDDPGKDNDMQHAARMARELMGSVRKIKIASLMYERTLICVSGMQGAGKTTLMKHFYGLDDDCLNISLERGEEIPVFITEKEGMPADKKPELYAIRIMKDAHGEYHQQELEMSPEEFRDASKGKNAATLYLELRVPYKHTTNEKPRLSCCLVLRHGKVTGKLWWTLLLALPMRQYLRLMGDCFLSRIIIAT